MKTTDLTQGSIFKSLWIMAVPLISASFIQMAYSMTDMLWLQPELPVFLPGFATLCPL
jgi:Na+-driven multidrug efflux pump